MRISFATGFVAITLGRKVPPGTEGKRYIVGREAAVLLRVPRKFDDVLRDVVTLEPG
jgi:hypothetical protein